MTEINTENLPLAVIPVVSTILIFLIAAAALLKLKRVLHKDRMAREKERYLSLVNLWNGERDRQRRGGVDSGRGAGEQETMA
ncbi:hypothetical protein CAEBREN_23725 [Caenorhabditis brenneri]|nr:hypothetical protein CAEBREN_23725 [Caenorhabditis brenneri]